MATSCTDYVDAFHNALGELGLIAPGELPDDDPGGQYAVVGPLIQRLAVQNARLFMLVDQAAAPGGFGGHEPGHIEGWFAKAAAAMGDGPVDVALAGRILRIANMRV